MTVEKRIARMLELRENVRAWNDQSTVVACDRQIVILRAELLITGYERALRGEA